MAFQQGACCEITGLVAAAQHNGKRCTLMGFHEDNGRWQVQLDGGAELSVRPTNLTQVVVVVDSSDDENIAPSRRKKQRHAASDGGASDSDHIRSFFMPNPAADPAADLKAKGAAADLKEKGNAAFQAKDYTTAVWWFTKAIAADGANHVLFSNRSAAFAGLAQWDKALGDADMCISLKPDWGKGYARCGAAHHGRGDLPGAYKQGLTVEPGLAMLIQGLASVKASGQGGEGSGQQEPDSAREPETVRKAPRGDPAVHKSPDPKPGAPDCEP
ncbi:hypothetical protein T484DRAFT_1915103 [Baffinella frigidus]|nr:hypothetical protein T484DRAFT_1915103 [Cryptophyta sp. CCMP2293]